MRPAQFVTQCVTNWKRSVEEAHVAEIRGVETASELGGKRVGQRRKETLSVRRPLRAVLLVLYDLPSDLLIGLNLNLVHGACDPLPCIRD